MFDRGHVELLRVDRDVEEAVLVAGCAPARGYDGRTAAAADRARAAPPPWTTYVTPFLGSEALVVVVVPGEDELDAVAARRAAPSCWTTSVSPACPPHVYGGWWKSAIFQVAVEPRELLLEPRSSAGS